MFSQGCLPRTLDRLNRVGVGIMIFSLLPLALPAFVPGRGLQVVGILTAGLLVTLFGATLMAYVVGRATVYQQLVVSEDKEVVAAEWDKLLGQMSYMAAIIVMAAAITGFGFAFGDGVAGFVGTLLLGFPFGMLAYRWQQCYVVERRYLWLLPSGG